MKLTDAERLLIPNQCEILAVLQDDDGYAAVAEQLREGYKWLYDQYLERLQPNLSDELTGHVLDVLSMYEALQDSYRRLPDKSCVRAQDVEFPGFDGNGESEQYAFSRALTKADRYVHVIGDIPKNSHMPTFDSYSRMLDEWRAMGKPHGEELDEAGMTRILRTRVHPDHR